MLSRRYIAILLVLFSFLLLVSGLPLLLPICLIIDFAASNRFAMMRVLLFVVGFLAMELLGVLISFVIWLAEIPRPNERRFERRNYELQNWWGVTIAKMGIRVYDLSLRIKSPFEKTNEPFILFIRHSSFIDTFLPIFLISSVHRTRLRYVLKEELLWGPCLNIIGNRIPNVFVRRNSEDSEHQISKIRDLARNTSEGEGIVLYPEGTRFTHEKQERIRAKAKGEGHEAFRRALRFESVLPLRRGGARALLETLPNADAVFCAHSGLESTVGLRNLLSGQLVGTTIRVNFRRIINEAIPKNEDEQSHWLDDRWSEVDRTVAESNANPELACNEVNK